MQIGSRLYQLCRHHSITHQMPQYCSAVVPSTSEFPHLERPGEGLFKHYTANIGIIVPSVLSVNDIREQYLGIRNPAAAIALVDTVATRPKLILFEHNFQGNFKALMKSYVGATFPRKKCIYLYPTIIVVLSRILWTW